MRQDADLAQHALVQELAAAWQRGGLDVSFIETHISRVVLAGPYAYKFKKPVRFPFLDFTPVAMRRFYCEEECRLGRRLAPDLYLGVMAITGTTRHPVLDGAGAAIEFAVKMQRFPQEALWTARIADGVLSRQEIDALAAKVARFHGAADIAVAGSPWGTADVIFGTADDTFKELDALLDDGTSRERMGVLRGWDAKQRSRLAMHFERRKRQGAVRECHGDLHCSNILTLGGKVEVFDSIEFSSALRWIDVMNDIAFASMDLRFRGEKTLSARLLNKYLAQTGDYDGLAVFAYYQVHHALVRCKVALLAASQLSGEGRAASMATAVRYLESAIDIARPEWRAIVVTHGFSGSGKSTFASAFAERSGAIMLRSDIERKRLYNRSMQARQPVPDNDPLYSSIATRHTYERLRDIARYVIAEAHLPVIVDAAFLRAEQRSMFSGLARELGVPFLIVDIHANEAAMRERLEKRSRENQDPSDADTHVLLQQIRSAEPLGAEESGSVFSVDMDGHPDQGQLSAACDLAFRRCVSRIDRTRP
ncbi:AAA family ATPase [Noviherbaspirillum denitrificans]|uniref:Aminoglycoside phosphotransferase n=1 Tax=Noviherbaspirillum denitrificans TaxID=1968433 RepID=A0A254TFD2_9BURK|nr:bifunctional aminoglycoside phosphotransferase/ATP-binding protein [Noviherbaspirillum denitrificans]OWW21359.1 hypothetical protein AYR66_19610 [Noviherbaspirillum denitrificans]